MKCISCGNEIPNDMKFCRYCGMPNRMAFEPQPETPKQEAGFCMSCGTPLVPGAVFCTKCGKRVTPLPAQAPVKAQPAAISKQEAPKKEQAPRITEPVHETPSPTPVKEQTPAQPQVSRPAPAKPAAPVRQPSAAEVGFMGLGEYLIDEKVSAFRFENAYTVYDGAGNPAGAIQQVNISGGAKAARVLLGSSAKAMQSFQFDILDNAGKKLASVRRGGMGGGIAALRTIQILDAAEHPIGRIQIVPGWTPKMQILDAAENQVGLISGNWRGWNFTVQDANGTQIGAIDKKWNGFGKEFFTNADKYHVTLDERIRPDQKVLITAAAVTVDMVMHELN